MMKKLTAEQRRILKAARRGENVFYTGAAGTGKTMLLREIISALKLKYPGRNEVAVTGTTGLAAINIKGVTLHSFAGIGHGDGKREDLAHVVRASSHARKRWAKCKVLVIDEISQLSAELFQKLEFIARKIRPFNPRKSKLFFGGIQIVCCGDFAQLPPVGLGKKIHYCFDCQLWRDMFHSQAGRHFLLREIFRQSEQAYISSLNSIRTKADERAIDYFKRLGAENVPSSFDGVEIVTTNKHADKINEKHLLHLINTRGKEYRDFQSTDFGASPFLEALVDENNIPTSFRVAVGARVILTKNIDFDAGLVNGLQGVVVGFKSVFDDEGHSEEVPQVRFHFPSSDTQVEKTIVTEISRVEWGCYLDGNIIASRTQIPLRLGWAITVHRSQGMEFSNVKVDLERIFEYGQAYVALSRCTDSKHLYVSGLSWKSVRVHPKVSQYYNLLTKESSAKSKTGNERVSRKINIRNSHETKSGKQDFGLKTASSIACSPTYPDASKDETRHDVTDANNKEPVENIIPSDGDSPIKPVNSTDVPRRTFIPETQQLVPPPDEYKRVHQSKFVWDSPTPANPRKHFLLSRQQHFCNVTRVLETPTKATTNRVGPATIIPETP